MTETTRRSHPVRARIFFVALCLGLGLSSWVGGDWLARSWLFERGLGPLETFRADGGQYVVNAFLSGDGPAETPTAVVFGDSANDSMPPTDRDRRFITEMLQDELGSEPISIRGVSFPGNSPDWITSHLRYLLHRFAGFDYAVIPLNLRWISPGWRGKSDTSERRAHYERYAAGPFRWVFGIELPYRLRPGFDPKKQPIETVLGKLDANAAALDAGEYRNLFGGDSQNAVRQVRWLRTALSYGFRLADADPLFAVVDRIGEDCAASGLRCLFYLPPFNLDYIERSAPPVASALRANIAQVKAYMRSRGLVLLDLSAGLPERHFHDIVNEHVDQVGRRMISRCIAEALRAWHRTGKSAGARLACSDLEERRAPTLQSRRHDAGSSGPVPVNGVNRL